MTAKPEAYSLLLGASGILGSELAAFLGSQCSIRTHCSRPVTGSSYFDARCMDVRSLWQSKGQAPSAAVVMLGITAMDECARNPEVTAEINVSAVIRVIDRLLELGVTPVFVSSDGVFDGTRSWWTEHDEPHPILEYGRQKLAVERHVAKSGQGLVVRLPKLLEDHPGRSGVLTGWINALSRSEPILCATDQFFTPASARDAAGAIALLVERGCKGLYHVAGAQRLSRRDLLAEVLDEYRRFAIPHAPILDCRLEEIGVFEPRPLDTSLSCRRIEADLGCSLRGASIVARSAVRSFFQARS